jgi:hypothetical protein
MRMATTSVACMARKNGGRFDDTSDSKRRYKKTSHDCLLALFCAATPNAGHHAAATSRIRRRVALRDPAANANAEARLFVLLRNECLSRRAHAGDLNDDLAILGPGVMGSLRWLRVEGAGGIGFELALIPLVAGGEIERS